MTRGRVPGPCGRGPGGLRAGPACSWHCLSDPRSQLHFPQRLPPARPPGGAGLLAARGLWCGHQPGWASLPAEEGTRGAGGPSVWRPCPRRCGGCSGLSEHPGRSPASQTVQNTPRPPVSAASPAGPRCAVVYIIYVYALLCTRAVSDVRFCGSSDVGGGGLRVRCLRGLCRLQAGAPPPPAGPGP